MNNDTEADHTVSLNNPEYAKEWVEYLKKKNARLSIVWPILLTVSVIFLVVALYFYQQNMSTAQRLDETFGKLGESQSRGSQLDEELEKLKNVNNEFRQELESLQTIKSSLEQQKGDSNTRLNLTSKLAETLRETVGVMETEKQTMLSALGDAKKLLLKQKRENRKRVAELDKKHKKSKLISTKAISDRKIAYGALVKRQHEMQGEIDRLAAIVDSQDADLGTAKKAYSQLKDQLKTYRQRVASLNERNENLSQAKLSKSEENSSNTLSRDSSGLKSNNADGLDEIKKPLVNKTEPLAKPSSSTQKEAAKNAATVFEFDSIAVDQP